MDDIDVKMLKILQLDGRISISELSKRLSLSRPSVADRLHKLLEEGVIERFSAIVSPESVGRKLLVMIELDELKKSPLEIEEVLSKEPRILECHRATGHVHYYVKAALSGMDDLQELIERLIPLCNTRTSFLLKTSVEESTVLPIEADR